MRGPPQSNCWPHFVGVPCDLGTALVCAARPAVTVPRDDYRYIAARSRGFPSATFVCLHTLSHLHVVVCLHCTSPLPPPLRVRRTLSQPAACWRSRSTPRRRPWVCIVTPATTCRSLGPGPRRWSLGTQVRDHGARRRSSRGLCHPRAVDRRHLCVCWGGVRLAFEL